MQEPDLTDAELTLQVDGEFSLPQTKRLDFFKSLIIGSESTARARRPAIQTRDRPKEGRRRYQGPREYLRRLKEASEHIRDNPDFKRHDLMVFHRLGNQTFGEDVPEEDRRRAFEEHVAWAENEFAPDLAQEPWPTALHKLFSRITFTLD